MNELDTGVHSVRAPFFENIELVAVKRSLTQLLSVVEFEYLPLSLCFAHGVEKKHRTLPTLSNPPVDDCRRRLDEVLVLYGP